LPTHLARTQDTTAAASFLKIPATAKKLVEDPVVTKEFDYLKT